MSTYKLYKTFNDLNQTHDFIKHLEDCDIPSVFKEVNSPLGSVFGSSGFDKHYEVMIPIMEFKLADSIAKKIAEIAINNVEKGHYLFDFTEEELKEIQDNPDDWSEFDQKLSLKILSQPEKLPKSPRGIMLEGKERGIWEKLGDINYVNIPVVEKVIDDADIWEVKNSRSNTLTLIIILSILSVFLMYSCFEDPELFYKRLLFSLSLGTTIVSGIIGLSISYYQDKVILRLTAEGLEYKNKTYKWRLIKNMYQQIQNDENSDNHSLIVVTYGEEVNISLDYLDKYPWEVMDEVGKFYWNWQRNSKH